MDFDRPRESPFSNANVIPNHSAASSVSTNSSTGVLFPKPPENSTKRAALDVGLALPEPDRLSVMTATRRGRSASDASQNSMGFGDFYDAYYRQSVLAQRASVASQVLAINNNSGMRRSGSMDSLGVGVAITSNGNGNLGVGGRGRPSALKLGGSGLVEQTIVEVATPAPSPMVGRERFPTRI